jgi:hypothetical protein
VEERAPDPVVEGAEPLRLVEVDRDAEGRSEHVLVEPARDLRVGAVGDPGFRRPRLRERPRSIAIGRLLPVPLSEGGDADLIAGVHPESRAAVPRERLDAPVQIAVRRLFVEGQVLRGPRGITGFHRKAAHGFAFVGRELDACPVVRVGVETLLHVRGEVRPRVAEEVPHRDRLENDVGPAFRLQPKDPGDDRVLERKDRERGVRVHDAGDEARVARVHGKLDAGRPP